MNIFHQYCCQPLAFTPSVCEGCHLECSWLDLQLKFWSKNNGIAVAAGCLRVLQALVAVVIPLLPPSSSALVVP